MKSKNLVAFAVALCVGTAVYRLHKVYLDHKPLAEPGECIEMNYEGTKLNFLIISNSSLNGESTVLSLDADFVGKLSFQEMREGNGHKVACP